ncbi:hypothetical protein LTR22_024355 [Elasticomyces elasticus]|nr:hypothetical protein LTR22_024355 [Elasticomyces elasticus]
MAYHDPYESRPRSSRQSDSFTRPRDAPYVNPAVGYASSSHHDRERYGVGGGEVRPDYARVPRYSYDARDTRAYYPPPPPPDVGRPGPPRRSLPIRRQSWPPPPCCEDEATSLAKEAGSAGILKKLKHARKDEVQSRGTIDQEPVIEEVPELINQHERRFVLSSDSEKESRSKGVPTPPTSEDERSRKLRRRPSRLNTKLNEDVPEMARRTASPYAYTKPTRLEKGVSSNDRYLSPTVQTPPPTDSSRRRRERLSTTSKAPSSRRESMRVSPSGRKGNDYFSSGYGSSENAVADDDWDTSDSQSRDRRRKAATQTYPPPQGSSQTAVKDFASNVSSIRRMNLNERRNTDTGGAVPALRVDKSRRPGTAGGAPNESAIYSAPGTPGGHDLPFSRSRESSYVSSRGISPAAEPSPPPSARQSRDMSQTYTTTGSSSPHSGAGSASASRPASPVPRVPGDTSRLPKTDLDWSALLAANAARRAKPPSRLASSMRQDSIPDVYQAPQHANSLPYPKDLNVGSPSIYMPSERDHAYFPTTKPSLAVPYTSESKTLSRSTSPASNASRASSNSKPSRPALTTRHSVANGSLVDERPKPAARRHDSFSNSSQTKKELSALMKKGLPDCPRPQPVAGYDDWYTVIGAPGLAFCPDCVDSVFERTVFRPSIRRLPQLNLNTSVKCAFGSSPWLRLAWLLTLQQQRTDLTLMRDLTDIDEANEPCPGGVEAVRSWYGLRDREGYYVKDFHICGSDVRKIERLLPTLSGFFVRLPQRASYSKYTCGIRAEGNRFSAYLDALIATHERALASRKSPDPMPFVDLVERKSRLRECTRDNMLIGGLWHYTSSIPSLTICEDCYEAVVEPEVRKNSDLALRFNRTVQPVYDEGMGSSCQLYSRRMRKVFQRAIEDNDAKYLARKSKERRDAEVRLQERYKDILRQAKRLSRDGGEDDERRLNRELERITEEWQAKWE